MALSTDMTRLLDTARMRLPGALDTPIKYELFQLFNDFFQKSNIWYEDVNFTANPATKTYLEDPSQYTYTIAPTSGGAITRLYGVVNSQGIPQKSYMPTLGQLVLAYAPASANAYTCRVLLTVTDPVDSDGIPTFPAWVLNKYGSDFLNGLLGRMMAQPAKPYSNVALAQYHLRQWQSGVSRAKSEASHQNVYRGQQWMFPQNFNHRRYYSGTGAP